MPPETPLQQRSHEQTTETLKKKARHTPDVVELDMRQTQSGTEGLGDENMTCFS